MTALIVQLGTPDQTNAPLLPWDRSAVGKANQEIISRGADLLQNKPPPSSLVGPGGVEQSVEDALFSALAKVKILTSQVAMHLKNDWRNKIFRQLDSLHDINEWIPGDRPVQESSFFAFLKAILNIMPERQPSFGLSNNGNLIVAWIKDGDRLTIEFLSDLRVRWVLARHNDFGIDRFAGNVHINNLATSLAPYNPEYWFDNESKN